MSSKTVKKTVSIDKEILSLANKLVKYFGSSLSGLMKMLILEKARELKFSDSDPS